MAFIVFSAVCLMGCGFMVYALVQWIRDAQPNTARRHEDSQAPDRKQPHIVSSHKTSRNRGSAETQLIDGEHNRERLNSSLHDSEKIVRQRIARFPIPRRRA